MLLCPLVKERHGAPVRCGYIGRIVCEQSQNTNNKIQKNRPTVSYMLSDDELQERKRCMKLACSSEPWGR